MYEYRRRVVTCCRRFSVVWADPGVRPRPTGRPGSAHCPVVRARPADTWLRPDERERCRRWGPAQYTAGHPDGRRSVSRAAHRELDCHRRWLLGHVPVSRSHQQLVAVRTLAKPLDNCRTSVLYCSSSMPLCAEDLCLPWSPHICWFRHSTTMQGGPHAPPGRHFRQSPRRCHARCGTRDSKTGSIHRRRTFHWLAVHPGGPYRCPPSASPRPPGGLPAPLPRLSGRIPSTYAARS
jgi:hypothetical protein